jgi:hypothetical protein
LSFAHWNENKHLEYNESHTSKTENVQTDKKMTEICHVTVEQWLTIFSSVMHVDSQINDHSRSALHRVLLNFHKRFEVTTKCKTKRWKKLTKKHLWHHETWPKWAGTLTQTHCFVVIIIISGFIVKSTIATVQFMVCRDWLAVIECPLTPT